MSPPWWDLLSSLCYLRLNYAHFNRARHPTWCEGDPLLASNINDLISMTQLLRKDALGQHPEVIAGLQQAFPNPENAPNKKFTASGRLALRYLFRPCIAMSIAATQQVDALTALLSS